MPKLLIQLPVAKLPVIRLQVPHHRHLQQVIPLIHLRRHTLQRAQRLRCIRHNRLLSPRQHRQIRILDVPIQRQLNLLRIHQHEFQIVRMALIQQTRNNRINPHRFPRTRRTRHQQMRHLRQINQKNLILNRLPKRHRQLKIRLRKLLRLNHRLNKHHHTRLIRHLNPHRRSPRNRRNHPQPVHRCRHLDVIRIALNLANLHIRRRLQLIQRHRRPHNRIHTQNLDLMLRKLVEDNPLIPIDLLHIRLILLLRRGVQQIRTRELVPRLRRLLRLLLIRLLQLPTPCFLLLLPDNHIHLNLIRFVFISG